MPFVCEPVVEKNFKHLEDVNRWISENEDHLTRASFARLMENGARFFDDEYFGHEDQFLRFNETGMRALLQKLGLRFDILQRVERPGLISELLNDLIYQQDFMERLDEYDFVVDQRTATVLGGVSKSYVFYSNQEFLRDIRKLLEPQQQESFFPTDRVGRFRYVDGFSINTQMFLRFSLTVEGGRVTGEGGEGEDISEVGIQFKNSMVGDAAVSIQYFVNRLICANGLIVPAGSRFSRVYHSGKRKSFMERLTRAFDEVDRKIRATGKSIRSLMEMDFDPGALAKAGMSDKIFAVIPGSRSRIMQEHNIRKRQKKAMMPAEHADHEARIIGLIPKTFAGPHALGVFDSPYRENATLFDFINIFTEYAQEQPIHKRLEIEERAGVLADHIVKNKRKFAVRSTVA